MNKGFAYQQIRLREIRVLACRSPIPHRTHAANSGFGTSMLKVTAL